MGAETEGFDPVDQIFRPAGQEVGPVDRRAPQISAADHGAVAVGSQAL